MDPIAAIGLASNIVQFVDFSLRLFNEAKELYDSQTGLSADNDILELISRDILSLNNKLTAPSAPGAIPDSVRSLASQCKDVANELLETLRRVRVQDSHKKWRSFVQALRSVWEKSRIENLCRRLAGLRDEMQISLQFILR